MVFGLAAVGVVVLTASVLMYVVSRLGLAEFIRADEITMSIGLLCLLLAAGISVFAAGFTAMAASQALTALAYACLLDAVGCGILAVLAYLRRAIIRATEPGRYRRIMAILVVVGLASTAIPAVILNAWPGK